MKQVPLRFPEAEVMPRVERLLGPIRADAGFSAVRVSASVVLRMALLEGLEVLEKQYLKD